MSGTPTPRQQQRERTRERVLEASLEVMAERGVAGLVLSEVASRVGLRQPSLYAYVASREALYDELFRRGMEQHAGTVRAALGDGAPGLAAVRRAMVATVRFAVEQPVLAQLLFQRVVPGFTPSAEAYAPSLEVAALVGGAVQEAVRRGELHRDAASRRGVDLLVALTAGVATLQVTNDPGSGFDEGRFAPLVHDALDLWQQRYGPRGGSTAPR
ncbi:TetR/AcrR family transcriptional regulator [Vallicoccus soli]|nr:TetR/AcrR family transcriptional regulator [Vallicoccus soli]